MVEVRQGKSLYYALIHIEQVYKNHFKMQRHSIVNMTSFYWLQRKISPNWLQSGCVRKTGGSVSATMRSLSYTVSRFLKRCSRENQKVPLLVKRTKNISVSLIFSHCVATRSTLFEYIKISDIVIVNL